MPAPKFALPVEIPLFLSPVGRSVNTDTASLFEEPTGVRPNFVARCTLPTPLSENRPRYSHPLIYPARSAPLLLRVSHGIAPEISQRSVRPKPTEALARIRL